MIGTKKLTRIHRALNPNGRNALLVHKNQLLMKENKIQDTSDIH